MPIYLLLEGIAIGLVVAVPVGPLGLLCIHRALMLVWVHRVSGTVIAGFGIVVLLSLSPVKQSLGIQF